MWSLALCLLADNSWESLLAALNCRVVESVQFVDSTVSFGRFSPAYSVGMFLQGLLSAGRPPWPVRACMGAASVRAGQHLPQAPYSCCCCSSSLRPAHVKRDVGTALAS